MRIMLFQIDSLLKSAFHFDVWKIVSCVLHHLFFHVCLITFLQVAEIDIEPSDALCFVCVCMMPVILLYTSGVRQMCMDLNNAKMCNSSVEIC